MKKYQRLAEQLCEQIASGVWQPGDRLPSLREQVVSSGMSFMTVGHAYQLLESQGELLRAPSRLLCRATPGEPTRSAAGSGDVRRSGGY